MTFLSTVNFQVKNIRQLRSKSWVSYVIEAGNGPSDVGVGRVWEGYAGQLKDSLESCPTDRIPACFHEP